RQLPHLFGRERKAGRILYLVQSHELADERLREFRKMYGDCYRAIAFRGRGAHDLDVINENGVRPRMCRRHEAAKALVDAELSPGSEICIDCPHIGHPDPVERCAYLGQVPMNTDVIFASFAYAFLPKSWGRAHAVIVDENFVPAALEGANGERS